MNVVVIFNGLGNQMSQYAFYLAKRERCINTKYIVMCKEHNGYELERLFKIKQVKNIVLEFLLRILLSRKKCLKYIKRLLNCLKVRVVEENFSYAYNPVFLEMNPKGISFYYGGWHNYHYFDSIDIKDRLGFPVELIHGKALQILDMIKSKNSVSLHIRRGDYLNECNKKIYGGICTVDYYKNAITYIQQRVDEPFFFIFCNEKQWVEQNFSIENAIYVDCNQGVDSWIDMFLMTNCKHNILANSTFSWWGAFLSNNNGIKICPHKFVNIQGSGDIFLNDWVKM